MHDDVSPEIAIWLWIVNATENGREYVDTGHPLQKCAGTVDSPTLDEAKNLPSVHWRQRTIGRALEATLQGKDRTVFESLRTTTGTPQVRLPSTSA